MAGMNHRLNPNVETVFLMANDKYQFISSRFVKEIAQLGGEVSHFVSPRVARRIAERVGRDNGRKQAPQERWDAARPFRLPAHAVLIPRADLALRRSMIVVSL